MDEQKEPQIDSSVPQTPVEPVPDIEIPTLRTYKSDINQTVNKDKISTAKILIAEQNRQRNLQTNNQDNSIKRPTNILVLIVSILLIVAALGGIGYFGYTKVIKKTFSPITAPTTFLFIFDQEKFIDSSKDKIEISAAIQKYTQEGSLLKDETYTDIIFYKTNPETKDKTRISSTEFFKTVDISLPTNIARSISKDFVYGMYKTNGKVQPFLVLGVADYETMYSSMFVWESTVALDLKDLFPTLKDLFDLTKNKTLSQSQILATSTNTTNTVISTTTSQVKLTPEQEYQKQIEEQNIINRTIRFVDIVFSNKDARVVRDPNGTPFFYYSFIDKTKIIFSQDPKLLNEITRKIKEKSLVR